MDPPFNTKKIKNLMKSDPAAAAAMIKEDIEKLNNTPLNIAITGECGSGKSTFVNYFRGMTNDDEGAAPTGCVETTSEVKSYPHPNYPNVKLWDLPGIGTKMFPADTYLKQVGFKDFDFFIIISATRFTENDVKLAKKIQKMKKKFYFVRSKIDNDLHAEKKSKNNLNEVEIKEKIREYCIKGLQDEGIMSPQVFLLCSFDLHLHDFSLLHETLDRELPGHKKHALLMTMPNINLKVINKKKEAFKAQIKWYATASAAGAAVSVPKLSIAVDLGIFVTAITQYTCGFRLDILSMKKLADTTRVPYTDLIKVIMSPLTGVEITPALIKTCLSQLLPNVVSSVAGEELSTFIALINIPVAIESAFTRTYDVLNYFLNMLAEIADRVFKRALGLNSSV